MSQRITWVTGQADYTSSVFASNAGQDEDIFVLTTGDFGAAGTVALEFMDPAGTFRAFPETTFAGNAAQAVRIPAATEWRLAIAGCVNVNVELRR